MTKKRRELIRFDRKTKSFIGLSEDIINDLSVAFDTVHVPHEIKRMSLWLMKNTNRQGTYQFIVNWLSRSENYQLLQSVRPNAPKINNGLTEYYQQYLSELWKGREHILKLNSR